ncbi:MAG: rane fusion protein multidrug efflux system [Chthoniobacter sp.]|nr:rane fusion protein multidrug efflux system [Chthoniobacter sp.]
MINFRLFVLASLSAAALVSYADDTQGLVIPLKQVSVSSPVLQEVIDAVLVEEGDAVKESQVLIQLRKEKEVLEVQQAEQVVQQRRFTAEGAQKLYNERIGSKEAALEKQTELEIAKIQLAAAEVRLKEKTIRAPLSGIVVKKYKEAGEAVDRVEKLLDVVNIDQVYVQFYLDPKLMQTLKQDQEVPVRFAVIGSADFAGKISFIDPRIDAGSGLFRVKVLIDNTDHKIKAGMRGSADFAKVGK